MTLTKYSLAHLEKPLVFLHQARCGGNKLNFTFMNFFEESQWIKLGENFSGTSMKTYQDILTDIQSHQRKAYLGHHCYGLHQHINKPVSYISNFRDPISRVVSLYTRWQTDERHDLISMLAQSFEAENGLTKRLVGIGENSNGLYDFKTNTPVKSSWKVNDATFDEAIRVIDEELESILLMEKMNESCILFEQKFNLPALISLSINHLNQTNVELQLPLKFIPEQWIEWIISKNQYDIKLYDYVKQKFYRELQNASPATKEKFRLRHIFTSALSIKGQSILELADILKNFGDLFAKLHQFKMMDEFYQIAYQLVTHPEFPKEAGTLLVNQLVKALPAESKEKIQTLHEAIKNKMTLS